jgi:hypothetical protein
LWRWRLVQWSLITFLGCTAAGVAAVATMPVATAARMAGVVLPEGVVLTGTVRQGAAGFAAGHQVSWQTKAGQSVRQMGWAADVQIAGPDSLITGQMLLRADSVSLAPVQGQIGWALLAALLPGMEITCTTRADVNLTALAQTGDGRIAEGQINLAAGTCARVDGTVVDVPLPALVARISTTADGIALDATGADRPEVPLGRILVTPDDRLRVTVFAAGAAFVPGLPVSGDSQIELPLQLFVP